MGENRFSCSGSAASAARETYGIEASRILDACRDRDCFEDVRVFLTAVGEELIARTGNVRVKCAKLCGANISTAPIQFNRGFYTVDIKLYVSMTFEVCVPIGQSQEFEGIAVIEKRVVLFGGETNVSVFRSSESDGYCSIPEAVCCKKSRPEAVLEVLEPIVLGAHIVDYEKPCRCCCSCCDIPASVTDQINGTLNDGDGCERVLVVSLGLFSVVRLVRPGQFLINASEYCLPEKECLSPAEDDPCCTFRNMPFPTAEFCPPGIENSGTGSSHRGNGCCGHS